MPGCIKGGEPAWLDKVSFIISYSLNKCVTPWELNLKTGGKALGNLAMTMLWMDAADLARSFLRPKGSRSWRHSAPWLGRGKKRVSRGLFPEPSDLIASTTRSITGLKKPVYSDGFNHLWLIDTHLQKILNHILFVNMATDFAYDWFSGIVLAPESKCDIGRFSQTYRWGAGETQEFRMPVKFGDPDYRRGVLLGDNQVIINEGRWQVFGRHAGLSNSNMEGRKMEYRLLVGPVEKMRQCGKKVEITIPPAGKGWSEMIQGTVEGPCIVRVVEIVPDASVEKPFPSTVGRMQGFRLD